MLLVIRGVYGGRAVPDPSKKGPRHRSEKRTRLTALRGRVEARCRQAWRRPRERKEFAGKRIGEPAGVTVAVAMAARVRRRACGPVRAAAAAAAGVRSSGKAAARGAGDRRRPGAWDVGAAGPRHGARRAMPMEPTAAAAALRAKTGPQWRAAPAVRAEFAVALERVAWCVGRDLPVNVEHQAACRVTVVAAAVRAGEGPRLRLVNCGHRGVCGGHVGQPVFFFFLRRRDARRAH
jgi:hypothetical protein